MSIGEAVLLSAVLITALVLGVVVTVLIGAIVIIPALIGLCLWALCCATPYSGRTRKSAPNCLLLSAKTAFNRIEVAPF